MINLPILFTRVQHKNTQILRFFLISQLVCQLPFMITNLAMIHLSYSQCLLANFFDDSYFGLFTLGQWISMDGYIKLAILTTLLFFNVLQMEVTCKSVLVVLSGNILRFYYIFDFGWTIACSVLFWGKNSGMPMKTFQYCSGSPYKGYIFFLLIYSYIIIPINLYISGFRSKYEEIGDDLLNTTRRETEMFERS